MNNSQLIWFPVALGVYLVLCSYSLTFRRVFLSWIPGDNIAYYKYATLHGEFHMTENWSWKGHTSFSEVETHFNRFKHCYPNTADTILYRTFRRDGFQFWNWVAFYMHPRYKLPYIDPEKVPSFGNIKNSPLCPDEF